MTDQAAQFTEYLFEDGRSVRFLTEHIELAQLYLADGASPRAIVDIFTAEHYPRFSAMTLVVVAKRLRDESWLTR